MTINLSEEHLESFINKVMNRVISEISKANRQNSLYDYAIQHGLTDLLDDSSSACEFYKNNPRKARILILSVKAPRKEEWTMLAKKKYNIPSEKLDFRELKPNYDFSNLEYTDAYSDIIVGPIPHKGVGIDDNNSFLSAVERHPEKYPTVHRMTDSNGELSLSQSAFEKCLCNTHYVKERLNAQI